jgi:hypothetical protein
MSAIEQQHGEIHALVMAALQTSGDNSEVALQIEELLSSSLDDPLSDDFIPLIPAEAKGEAISFYRSKITSQVSLGRPESLNRMVILP